MEISKQSWHFRVYRWWYGQKHYQGKASTFYVGMVTICPYMRAVLFWSWMRLLFTTRVGLVAWPLLLIELPRWAGMVSYWLKQIVWIAYAVTAVMGGLGFIVVWINEWYLNRQYRPAETGQPDGFLTLTARWLKSIHEKVCPVILIDAAPIPTHADYADVGMDNEYEVYAKKTFEELLEQVEEQEGIGRSEGETGVKNLCRLVNILGYKDSLHFGQFAHNASYGDLIRFLEDNPGAIEALKDWICDTEQATDWREQLISFLPEDSDDEE